MGKPSAIPKNPQAKEELRNKLIHLPKNKPIFIYCQEGYRGYVATRILRQLGFEASNLLGGFKLWSQTQRTRELIHKPTHVADAVATSVSNSGNTNSSENNLF